MREENIAVFGSMQGGWEAFHQLCADSAPDLAVFTGDLCLEQPLELELADFLAEGGKVLWVPGGQDTATPERYDNLFGGALGASNLSGRVVEASGVRWAGLGGVFRSDIWLPGTASTFESRALWLATNPETRWRGGMPLEHRATVFPEDTDALAALQADVLVSHEAPSSHANGWRIVDAVAEAMGVHTVVHGGAQEAYQATLPNGIRVVGIADGALWAPVGLERRGAQWLNPAATGGAYGR
ncbi:hypothetical protein DFO45_5008 [Azorhizobium sp. AG788]|uniref:metallophosphoesterase family protein n=1 Tax=Azorhizobium sp. AG788 TaxID=2183897 RepID=UPI00105EC0A3|nr:metallophosphoesterase [Azorhizobium sp. AG788]TDT87334.1 hypothetical protein DFO45_5008 [Azorhizobium sp. AG788]